MAPLEKNLTYEKKLEHLVWPPFLSISGQRKFAPVYEILKKCPFYEILNTPQPGAVVDLYGIVPKWGWGSVLDNSQLNNTSKLSNVRYFKFFGKNIKIRLPEKFDLPWKKV